MKTLSFLVPHDSPFLSNTQRAQLESLQSPAGASAAPYRSNATLKRWRKAHVGDDLEVALGPRPNLVGHSVWWVAKSLGMCLLLVAAIAMVSLVGCKDAGKGSAPGETSPVPPAKAPAQSSASAAQK